jgi:drug/metabolite transporter (DMT)-like permease
MNNPTLVKCPACTHDVSSMATACPNCGHPMVVDPITTIQVTSKRWKKYTIVAVIFLFIGFFMMMSGISSSQPGTASFGFFLMFVAMVIGTIGRIGAWWTNG